MGRIHVLPEHVANKIAAGEVVERPASVVKELLENSLDAGARRIRINIEAGGRKLIQVIDDGCGMSHDDAMLAFERHATSKIRNADDLLNIATLGFRGEALPSIASVSRLRLETHAPEDAAGSIIEIAGGKLLTVEEAGLPPGTSITVRDLFFNIPARRKFLKAEPTELSHIASLVTHYALAHPDMHWELHSATNAMLIAPPVPDHAQRIYQVFGKETLDQLIPLSALLPLLHTGLPQPPPWRRPAQDEDKETAPTTPGEVRLHGFVSRPEIQKLNRNSIFIFVSGRLIRDRVVQHALTEAYRNIIPPTVYPVVLLFLEMPFTEVDVNVHPSKTEVRFRQSSTLHDFVRDSVRAAVMKARPVPAFMAEIHAQPTSSPSLSPSKSQLTDSDSLHVTEADTAFALREPELPPLPQKLQFGNDGIALDANAAIPVARFGPQTFANAAPAPAPVAARDNGCTTVLADDDAPVSLDSLATLKPLGQIRDSFILAVNPQGLWIIDQHVAHERVLFEKILRQRLANSPERQQMLMPLLVELTPSQMAVFAGISDELNHNGFEVEPFGTRTIAVKTTAAGVSPAAVEHLLHEILEQFEREEQSLNLEKIRTQIAASIACHAAIKVNMPLEQNKMEWLLQELAKTEYPMSCPHGRPVVLRYSVRDIQRAFKRI
ncbi:MAG TPA: DNA mismatch repair endonuclease MutL [Candidatus Eisenbacteria bacterium]|nr:DNA mismatch repair endonuclease MutL [Candidatus Eisenbacteria bacterium]